MRQPTTSPLKIGAREHEEKALALRRVGASYQQIGEALGITPSGAYRSVARVLARLRKTSDETAEEIRQQELMRLDEMQFALYPTARRGDTKAIETILKIQARRAKLLGLDAPEKVDVSGKAFDSLSDWIRAITEHENNTK